MENEESALDSIRTRPRFKIFTNATPEEYEASLKDYLAKHSKYFVGNIHRESSVIAVKTEESFFWQPQLSLRAGTEDGKTVVRGIFAPKPAIWTLFAFLYFSLGILEMVFLTMYFVEKQLKSSEFPWALTAAIIVLICILALYLAARWGQKKSAKEMNLLRKFAASSLRKFDEN